MRNAQYVSVIQYWQKKEVPGLPCGAGRKVVSSDSHIVKMWDQQTGVNFTNIEPSEGGLNDICLWKDSGLVMLACDAPKIQVSNRHWDFNT